MVNRVMVYPGAIPLETDILNGELYGMLGLGNLAQAVLGTGPLCDGLACAPTAVPSLAVTVGPGAIYSLQNVDGTAFGSLGADTAHQVVKQGLLADAVTLATPAPGTAGQSVVYLIQAAYADQDAAPVVLPYYNAADPAHAYNGPADTGVAQNTVRKGACVVAAKAGVPAATGSQAAPAPDAGYVGLYAVTVANAQSTVAAGNIAVATAAPFIAEKLTQKISKATADQFYGVPHGQCRLTKSGSNLLLAPCDGNRLTVGGVSRQVPAAGVTLAPTGLTVGTTYYVYAFMSGGAMALEASTTGHAQDAATGVEVKAGDATRTLVGMARVNTGPSWNAATNQRFVLSYFNRRGIEVKSNLPSNTSTTSTSYVELASSIRAEFLNWADDGVVGAVTGAANNTTANAVASALSFNGATPEDGFNYAGIGANLTAPVGVSVVRDNLGEGYNYTTLFGKVGGGTGTWLGGSAGATDTTVVSVITRG